MRILLTLLTMLLFSNLYAINDRIMINKGEDAEVYCVFVGTTPYEAIADDYADLFTDQRMKNIGTADVFFDFDVTVTTGQTAG